MKKELDEFITVLDDAVDMQDNGKYQDILDNAYQDGTFHDLRRHLNKQTKRMRELEEDMDHLYELIDKVAKLIFNVEQQNKHYREALEFYALGRHWVTSLKDGRDYVNEYGELAEKALEESG